MFKSAARAAPRRIVPSRSALQHSSSRRFLSTTPTSRGSRSWKGSAARWTIAAGAVYYYNTSNVFAEEPEVLGLDESIRHVQDSDHPTIDAIVEGKRQRAAERAVEQEQREQVEQAAAQNGAVGGGHVESEGSEGAEEEEGQQGAFNPETGEINWDCPCLGGMAHGPCGEEFRAAFSCFVYSDQEPKGVECIDKFKGMQDCFRLHPEMYGSELEDDEEEIEEELHARQQASAANDQTSQTSPEQKKENTSTTDTPAPEQTVTTPQQHVSAVGEAPSQPSPKVVEEAWPVASTTADNKESAQAHRDSQHTASGEAQRAGDEDGELIPKAAHDASSK